jgi:methylphosphotriester-DNA--protein-cysteine methyltransferase
MGGGVGKLSMWVPKIGPSSSPTAHPPLHPPTHPPAHRSAEEDKAFHVWNLLDAKKKSKLSFTEIANRTGLTNAYVAQLFYRQVGFFPISSHSAFRSWLID